MHWFQVKLKVVAAEERPFSPFLTMEVICTGYKYFLKFSVPDARQILFPDFSNTRKTNKQANKHTYLSPKMSCKYSLFPQMRECKPRMTMLNILANVCLEDPLRLQC